MAYRVDELLGLLVAVSVLALLARRLAMPYPILLVLGGLGLGFVPGLPVIRLNPDLIFVMFLPPLLYPAALFSSWRDFHANLRPIMLLAVGLVLVTTVTVGYFAHYLIPGLPLAAAFILGAIISPPDAVAATAVTQRLSVPQRIVTIIEGESLVNDAIALVAYEFAIKALNTGTFSLPKASVNFLFVAAGGIAFGLLVGWIAEKVQKRLDDPPVQITLSILTAFAAYLPAQRMGLSGVLSVVASGFYLGWRSPEIVNSRMRLQAGPVWEMIEFVLNGLVFVLIGLQLPHVLKGLTDRTIPMGQLIWYALLISGLTILVRFVWVFTATYVPRWLFPSLRKRDPLPGWRNVVIVAWTGMRGVVSLAAALALPAVMAEAPNLKESDLIPNLIIFFTYVVILVTLVLQGLTLPFLIRWLKVVDTGQSESEEREARLKANLSAMSRLTELEQQDKYPVELMQHLRVEYEDRIRQLESCEMLDHTANKRHSSDFEKLQHEVLQVERKTIIRLRNERVINDHVLRRIQRDLDLAEARIQERD